MLYVDGVTVSFDGFRALNSLSLDPPGGRAAHHHRPERRRQDDDDGRHHRQDPARRRHGPFQGDVDLTRLDETSIARLGRRPQVPEAHRLRGAHRRREPRAGPPGRSRPAPDAAVRRQREERDRIDRILGLTGLGAVRRRRAGELSHGQKQWLEIGMLLMQDPRLIMLDEPVAGMTDSETGRPPS
jgi:urea transport system ATP-binding protein